MIYWQMFITFLKIGAFTLGGGYAMIPLVQDEVVSKRKWIDEEEFLNMLALAQSAPGVMAVNTAIFIGYKMRGWRGVIVTTLGSILPSFVIILLIAMFFHQFEDNKVIAALFRGIRPAVVALIAVPTFNLARKAKINLSNCWIPILGAMAIWAFGVSPIIVIILAGLGGYIYGKYIKPTE